MKRIFKGKKSLKGLVIALSITMITVTSVGAFVFADQTDSKSGDKNANDGVTTTSSTPSNDETVYIITDANGDENQRIVSEDGTLHYEGYEDCQLPVTMSISYTLDGKSIEPSDLAGKDGHVVMNINYKNNIKSKGVYVPFLVVSGLILNNDNFSNIKVTNGKKVDDGSKNVVVGYSFPGMSQNIDLSSAGITIPDGITITADVKDFELETVYSFATNEVFKDMDLQNVSSIGDLKSQLSKLKTGVETLVTGTADLYKGTQALTKGIDKLTAGTNQLKTGAKKLYAGTSELVTKSKTLVSGTDQLKAGSKKVYDGTVEAKSGVTELNSGLKTLSQNSDSIVAGAKKILDSALNTANNSLNGIRQLAPGRLPATLTYENYATTLDAAVAILQGADAQNGSDHSADIAQLQAAKTQIASLLEYYGGVKEYTDGVNNAATGATTINTGMTQLVGGSKQVYDGLTQMRTSENTLITGINKLNSGAKELSDGTNLLRTSEGQLVAGVSQLNEGARKLSEGVSNMADEGLSKLEKLGSSDLLNVFDKINAIGNASKSYGSFGNKGSYESVKFIYKTAEITSGK